VAVDGLGDHGGGRVVAEPEAVGGFEGDLAVIAGLARGDPEGAGELVQVRVATRCDASGSDACVHAAAAARGEGEVAVVARDAEDLRLGEVHLLRDAAAVVGRHDMVRVHHVTEAIEHRGAFGRAAETERDEVVRHRTSFSARGREDNAAARQCMRGRTGRCTVVNARHETACERMWLPVDKFG
jgi:hypothetical protein